MNDKEINVFGICKCGAVIWVSGNFTVDETGRADSEWECGLCGSNVELYTE